MMDGTPSETVIRRRGTSFHADDDEEGEVGDIEIDAASLMLREL